MALTATVDDVNKMQLEAQSAINLRDQDAQSEENFNRKRAAYNALAQTYGPIAGDPDSAIKLNALSQSQQLFPSKLTEAQLNNQKSQQELDFNAQNNPLKLQNNALVLKQNQAKAPYFDDNARTASEQDKANLETTQLANAKSKQALDDTSEEDRQAASGVLASVKSAIAGGMDPGAAFDAYAPMISKLQGVDPEHLAPLRDLLVKDPQGTISRLEEGINAANPNASLVRAQAATTAANAAALNAQTKAQKAMADPRSALLTNDPEMKMQAVDVIKTRTDNAIKQIDDINALLDSGQIPSGGLVRSAMAKITGAGWNINNPMTNFVRGINQIKDEGSLLDMQATKAAGVTTPRSNAAMATARDAMSTLDPSLDSASIKVQLARLRATYKMVSDDLAAQSTRLRATTAKPAAPAGGAVAPQRSSTDVQPLSDGDLLKKYGVQ